MAGATYAAVPWWSAKSIKISGSNESSLSFAKSLPGCASAAEKKWCERKSAGNWQPSLQTQNLFARRRRSLFQLSRLKPVAFEKANSPSVAKQPQVKGVAYICCAYAVRSLVKA